MTRLRIAVVGSGISGLSVAYLLARVHDVALFERDDRVGGHSHTHTVAGSRGPIGVDSGFIVHNDRTYPNLLRLFEELGVETQPTEMSLAVRCDGCGLEYAGAKGLGGVLAQPRNVTNPRFVRMLAEIVVFQRAARAFLSTSGDDEPTLGDFVARGRYTPYFLHHYLLPLVAAVWSASTGTALDYPARYLFRFMANHGTLLDHAVARVAIDPGRKPGLRRPARRGAR